MILEVSVERHQDAGRAEAALQGVVAAEGGLQDREPTRLRSEVLDGAKTCAFDLNGEGEARARRAAIDLDGAGATHAVLATDVCTGETHRVTQEVGQQHARLCLAAGGPAAEREANAMPAIGREASNNRPAADRRSAETRAAPRYRPTPQPPYEVASEARGGMHIPARLQVVGECVEGIVEAVAGEALPIARQRPIGNAAHRQPS